MFRLCAVQRPVRKRVHAFDEFHDPIRLIANQPCQNAVAVAGIGFEQLRGAAYARQGILDFVSEHGGHGGDRAGGAAVRQLAVHFFSHGPLLQHDDHAVAAVRYRRHEHIDRFLHGEPRQAEIDAILADRDPRGLDLFDSGQQSRSEWKQMRQSLLQKDRPAHAEKDFGRQIGLGNEPVGGHRQNRVRQSVQELLRI